MFRILLKILNRLKLLKYLNLTGQLFLNNKTFKIPIIAGIGYYNLSMTEPWMIELLKKIIPLSKGTFIDVGVNVGQTLLKLRSVDDSMAYVGFEPNPTCIYYSKELIRINNLTRTKIIPTGINSETKLGELIYYYDDAVDSTATTLDGFRPEQTISKREYIPLFAAEELDLIKGMNSIGVIKIDVEGSELNVLQSFDSFIMKNNPFILLEILPVYTLNNTNRLERQCLIEKLVEKWGFQLSRVIIKNNEFVGIDFINEIGIHSDLNMCEYFLIPPDQVAQCKKFRIKN